jgi:hypothetical protein
MPVVERVKPGFGCKLCFPFVGDAIEALADIEPSRYSATTMQCIN